MVLNSTFCVFARDDQRLELSILSKNKAKVISTSYNYCPLQVGDRVILKKLVYKADSFSGVILHFNKDSKLTLTLTFENSVQTKYKLFSQHNKVVYAYDNSKTGEFSSRYINNGKRSFKYYFKNNKEILVNFWLNGKLSFKEIYNKHSKNLISSKVWDTNGSLLELKKRITKKYFFIQKYFKSKRILYTQYKQINIDREPIKHGVEKTGESIFIYKNGKEKKFFFYGQPIRFNFNSKPRIVIL
jgi:hypothetical protein